MVTAAAVDKLPNLAVAPVEGAVNVTVTPLTGLPPESLTVACNAVPKTPLIVALCGVPAVAVMLDAAPTVLVRLKLAFVPTPDTFAVTV